MSEEKVKNKNLKEILTETHEILAITQKIITKLRDNAQNIRRALKVTNQRLWKQDRLCDQTAIRV
jgi:hypothetical protein